jgi:hypothetical protein
VEPWREAKADAGIFDAAAYPIWTQIDHDTQSFEDIG